MGKRRKKGSGSIFQRSDGRWEGRVPIGCDKRGYPKTKNVVAKTKAECKKKFDALKLQYALKDVSVKSGMSYGHWLDHWYQTEVKGTIRPTTQQKYENWIYHHLIPQLGDIPLDALSTNDLQVFFNDLREHGRLQGVEKFGPGLSPQSVRSCYTLCKTSLEQAAVRQLIPRNPALGCKLASQKAREMQVLTQEEMQRFLIQAKEEGFYELFLLDLNTGMRRGELLGLQWNDLDFTTGKLKIVRQVYPVHGKVTIGEPKTKSSSRELILPPVMVEILAERKKEIQSPWIFPSPRKPEQPLDPTYVGKKLHQILKLAGCKDVRFHDLRHTFATAALERGLDIKTLSTLIGHSSTSTTLDIYGHSNDVMRKEAAKKIDKAITGTEATKRPETGRSATPAVQTFQPVKPKRRRPGTGCVSQINDHLWEGRYSPIWPDGKKHCRDVYANTEAECEEKLAELIKEMNAEIAAAKETAKMAISM